MYLHIDKKLFFENIGVTKSTNSNLLDMILSTFLVDIPDIFLKDESNWLNNEILHQVIKSCMEKDFAAKLDIYLKKNFSLLKIIDQVISWIDGNQSKIDPEDSISVQFYQFLDSIPLKCKYSRLL